MCEGVKDDRRKGVKGLYRVHLCQCHSVNNPGGPCKFY